MGCTRGTVGPRRAFGAAAVAVALAAAGHLSVGVEAQSGVPDVSGIWTRDGRASVPGELPLNARGVALREAVDESLAPMYDCVPATVPSIVADPYVWRIEQRSNRVEFHYEKDDVLLKIHERVIFATAEEVERFVYQLQREARRFDSDGLF